jgi:hypothetical protein
MMCYCYMHRSIWQRIFDPKRSISRFIPAELSRSTCRFLWDSKRWPRQLHTKTTRLQFLVELQDSNLDLFYWHHLSLRPNSGAARRSKHCKRLKLIRHSCIMCIMSIFRWSYLTSLLWSLIMLSLKTPMFQPFVYCEPMLLHGEGSVRARACVHVQAVDFTKSQWGINIEMNVRKICEPSTACFFF